MALSYVNIFNSFCCVEDSDDVTYGISPCFLHSDLSSNFGANIRVEIELKHFPMKCERLIPSTHNAFPLDTKSDVEACFVLEKRKHMLSFDREVIFYLILLLIFCHEIGLKQSEYMIRLRPPSHTYSLFCLAAWWETWMMSIAWS